MFNFKINLIKGISSAIVSAPLSGGLAALAGYIYAKFSDLPPRRAAKALAIWHAAEVALISLVTPFCDNEESYKWRRVAIYSLSSVIGMTSLLLTKSVKPDLVITLTLIRALAIYHLLYPAK